MREIDLGSWDGFEKELQAPENDPLEKDADGPFLYRGQGDSSWGLQTTLDRCGQEWLPLWEYQGLISA